MAEIGIKQAMIDGILYGVQEEAKRHFRNAAGLGMGVEEDNKPKQLQHEFIRLQKYAEMAMRVIEELPE